MTERKDHDLADNDNNQPAAPPVSVRVDLTSQDLRTGIIRLPLQLHDRFAAGEVRALAQHSDDTFLLSFSPPRELGGLQEFLTEHELRTNDAVVLHVDGQDVRLEPFYRRPRESQQQPATVTHAGLFGDVILPAELPEQETVEPEAEQDTDYPGLQPDLFGQASEQDQSDAPAHELEQSTERTTDTELATTLEPPAAVEAEHSGEPADFTTAWSDEPEDDFEADAGFAAFTENGAAAEVEPEQTGAASPPVLEPADDDDLPPMPAWRPPAAKGTQEETAHLQVNQQSPELSASSFHTVQRRAFTPRGRAQPRTARPAAAARQSRPVRDHQAAPEPAAPITAAEPAPAESTPAPATSLTQRQQLLRYLDSPDLPSILQAKQVAQALKMSEEEAASELAELSQQPDSRLSPVRPGFYLLKREGRD